MMRATTGIALAVLVVVGAASSTQANNDLDGLWKFLQEKLGFAPPDFSPMPEPPEVAQLLEDGYSHEQLLFHHSFTKIVEASNGSSFEHQVVVTYPTNRLINWRVLRDALLLGRGQLQQLRSGSLKDGDPLLQLQDKVMGYFDFIPRELAAIPAKPGAAVTFASPCYRQYTAEFKEVDETGGTLMVTVNHTSPYRTDCVGLDQEMLTFSSSLGYPKVHMVKPVPVSSGGGMTTFHMSILAWAKDEFAFLQQSGMHVNVWPLGAVGTVLSVLNTSELFVGADDEVVAERNAGFMGERVNFTMHRFDDPPSIVPDESEVRSGDILQVLKLDGLDPLIGWGTGSHTGHTTIIIKNSTGGTFVMESTSANPFGAVYWPPPYGVIITPYRRWFKLAAAAKYMLALTRLNDQASETFSNNVDQAWAFFNATQGDPYGFHNFIYSFFDTLWNSLPFPVTPYLFHAGANIADRLADNRTSQMSVYSLLTQGLNQRLGTKCETLECVNEELLRRDVLFGDVALMPELDTYRYEGQRSMVCDVFIFSMLKSAGVILDSIQATEQTPKDLYQVDIYNKTTAWFPARCKSSPLYDPAVPYCQVLGDYTLTLQNYSSIPQYAKMNERCYSNPFQSYWRGPNATTC
eukprot:scpid63096/ scgid29942/ 